MGLKFFTIILFLVSLLMHIAESRITKEILTTAFQTFEHSPNANNQGTNWAILVAGSNGFSNYRHQADICHAYHILKRGGVKEENIVVFMYDDIANNEENPRKGIIVNEPWGGDVYVGVPKDYTGQDLTINNLIAAILGDKNSIKGGSGKVVNSGPNDRIFIYYADHGAAGFLAMPNSDEKRYEKLYANDFVDTLKKKHDSGTYKSMVVYVEACESGSIFDGILPNDLNIYVTTSANPTESSYGTYCGSSKYPHVCLGDLYSVSWIENSESHLGSKTLEQQYEAVKKRTLNEKYPKSGSHVMQYGTISLSQEMISNYFNSTYSNKDKNNQTYYQKRDQDQSISYAIIEQNEADIFYLRQKVEIAQDSTKKAQAQKELDDELSRRKQEDYIFESIGKALIGYDIINPVRPAGQPIVDDWDCFKSMDETYNLYCGVLSTYGRKYMRAFANACNLGVDQKQMAKVMSQICRTNLKN